MLVLGCLSNYPNHEVIIMNRWGDIVYQASPYNNDWAGQANSGIGGSGKLTSGIYYYVVNFNDNTTPPVKSYIILKY
jgi:gliding motility-associated-like protein